ncbi:MAG: tetratricopeptide repeat protein [Alphaproteobacteria bacterium]|nr:tetratricopeptide repeat protein [Alphaproteobacteria bacterium]
MVDTLQGGGWSVDPDALGALRLEQARAALERGDAQLAVVEAEELLDDNPDHAEALLMVGDSALELNDAPSAHAAYGRYLELRPDDAAALSGLAIACFELTLIDACVTAAAKAVKLNPALGEAWYFLGMALEREGDMDRAGEAFVRAQVLDASTYPLVPAISEADWTAAVDEAWTILPESLRDWYKSVPVEVEVYPSLTDLRVSHPPLPPTASALYLGDPPDPGEGWKNPPAMVRLYRGNLQRMAAFEGDLPLRIAEALRHEALDWLGLEPEELPLLR